MATSGTTTFDLPIDEIIEEAFERTGMRGNRTGYQLKSARRSLNILFSEWGNRGVHLWKVKQATIPLVEGQAEYNFANDNANFPQDISDVLEAFVRNNTTATAPVDTTLTKIDRSAYAALANKLSKGTPSQYYVQRTVAPSIFLYQTPSSSFSGANFQLKFFYVARIQDAGAYTNETDVVYRFIPCMTSGLSYYLSLKYSPETAQANKLIYEDEMARALTEDGQRSSTFITPQTFYGDGV
jgi:hypothetical protein|tara:strand:+ start:125 stop:844 length:720 start_codon:yes stop_codon:yes gene_type:complete